jgi:hypothetical protein
VLSGIVSGAIVAGFCRNPPPPLPGKSAGDLRFALLNTDRLKILIRPARRGAALQIAYWTAMGHPVPNGRRR